VTENCLATLVTNLVWRLLTMILRPHSW